MTNQNLRCWDSMRNLNQLVGWVSTRSSGLFQTGCRRSPKRYNVVLRLLAVLSRGSGIPAKVRSQAYSRNFLLGMVYKILLPFLISSNRGKIVNSPYTTNLFTAIVPLIEPRGLKPIWLNIIQRRRKHSPLGGGGRGGSRIF